MGCDFGEMCGPSLTNSQLTPQLSREARRRATKSMVGMNMVHEELLAAVTVEALARMIEDYADRPGILTTGVDVYAYLQVHGILSPGQIWYGTYLNEDIHLLRQYLDWKLTPSIAEQLKRIMTRHGRALYLNLPYSHLSSNPEELWRDLRRHYIITMEHKHQNMMVSTYYVRNVRQMI